MGIRRYLWRILGDKRKADRHHAVIPVDYAPEKGPVYLFFHTLDISRVGAFLQTPNLVPVGTDLELTFSVPDVEHDSVTQPKKVVCHAAVARVQEGRKGLPKGMGIKFTDLNEKDWKTIGNYLKWLKGKRGSASVPARGSPQQLKDAQLTQEKIEDIKEAQQELAKEFEMFKQESKSKKD